MDDVGFPGKLVAMGFPEVARLHAFKVLKHYDDCWEDTIGNKLAGSIDSIRARRPSPTPAASQADVMREFEALRLRRNAAFPDLRQWKQM